MSEHSLWRFSRALQRAVTERRTDHLAPLIADDVEWSIFGPIEMFPFLGERRGKAAVLEVCQQVADRVSIQRWQQESSILEPDGAAVMVRCSLRLAESDRVVNLRLAQFARFENNMLVSLRAVIDTFDLVEQSLGRQIHLPRIA